MAIDQAAPNACAVNSTTTPFVVRLSSGARLQIQGTREDRDRYLAALQLWINEQDGEGGNDGELVIDVRLGEPAEPSEAAIECAGGVWVEPTGQALAPTRNGYVEYRRVQDNQWQITRSDFEQLDLDRALIKTIGLSRGILPLHASVANLDGHGIATIGRAESGKTSVLLNLLAFGAEWLTDDDADYERRSGVAKAYPRPVGAKWRYLRELRPLLRNASLLERLKMRSHRILRTVARQLKHCPLPRAATQKLKRVSEGESRLWIDFPNRIEVTQLDTVIFVIPGVQSELREVTCEEVCNSIAAVLWSELEPIHALDELLHKNAAPPLFIATEPPQQRLRALTGEFLTDRRLYVLTRTPRTSMRHMSQLLQPVLDQALSNTSSTNTTLG